MRFKLIPSIPGYGTLDRYILGKFLRTYVFGLLMIIIIVVVFDYVEKVDDFTELKAPREAIINDYYLNFIPYFINQFSSLFTFIAVIFFTSKLAMQTEIVAILSGGVSFRRLMWPYFLGAFIITVVNMSLSLWVIPQAQRDIIQFESQYIKSSQRVLYDDNAYRQIAPGTFAYVRGYSPRAEVVSFFALEQYDDSKLTAKLEAASATFDEESGRWTAPRYATYSLSESGAYDFELHRNLDTLINLDARELGETKSLVKTMTISELNDYITQQREKSSDDVYIIEVERHARFSYPIATFILTLIGVSLSSRKIRGGMGLHIGVGITLCFTYILFGRFFEEFAKSGGLPVGLAGWIPNIIFAIIAVYLYRKAPK